MQKNFKGREVYFSATFSLASMVRSLLIRILRSEDGEGSENIAYKVNSRLFNLHRDSSSSITLSSVGELFWSWIPEKPYPSSEWERKFQSSLFTSSIKREIRHFLVVVLQWRQRNVQKSVMHVQSCCFANPSLLFFETFRCRRRHRILMPRQSTKTEVLVWVSQVN